MADCPIQIIRSRVRFTADTRRVITRPFMPGDPVRLRRIIDRVLALSEREVLRLLARVRESFASRHLDLEGSFQRHYEAVMGLIDDGDGLSRERQLLIGAYFTHEYSFESAALFNPSVVPHPNQAGLPDGSVRVLMSLRATGEGHVSSIVFRAGIIGASGDIHIAPPSPYARSLHPLKDQVNEKQSFLEKLIEMGGYNDTAGDILDGLPDPFTDIDLDRVLDEVARREPLPPHFEDAERSLRWLARSDYELALPANACPSELVIFPASEAESRGMEDMRLVHFTEDDGSTIYYGIYTAFNGWRILPMLMSTRDFKSVWVTPLHGQYARDKGLALFPRKLDGWYAMVARVDGENLYLLKSKNIRFWNDIEPLRGPLYPWEFVQIGNCGSPIETGRGWLLITHGVGPMRQYCIGALLLDRDDPTRVIGQTREPLIVPAEDERDGYVPNVVYSCGSMTHNGALLIPYAMSDVATSFITVRLEELLDYLVANNHG